MEEEGKPMSAIDALDYSLPPNFIPFPSLVKVSSAARPDHSADPAPLPPAPAS